MRSRIAVGLFLPATPLAAATPPLDKDAHILLIDFAGAARLLDALIPALGDPEMLARKARPAK